MEGRRGLFVAGNGGGFAVCEGIVAGAVCGGGDAVRVEWGRGRTSSRVGGGLVVSSSSRELGRRGG